MPIIIDTREREEIICSIFNNLGIQYERKKLEWGDFSLGAGLYVERKTISDFYQSLVVADVSENIRRVHSLYERRIEQQLSQYAKIPDIVSRGVLAVTGNVGNFIRKKEKEGRIINRNIIYGAISSAVVRYGIEVWLIDNDIQLVKLMDLVNRKIEEGKLGIITKLSADLRKDPLRYRAGVLSQIRAVNPAIAYQLLQKFGNVKNIANAKEEEFLEIYGVGKTKAKEIWEFFNQKVEVGE